MESPFKGRAQKKALLVGVLILLSIMGGWGVGGGFNNTCAHVYITIRASGGANNERALSEISMQYRDFSMVL